MRSAHWSHQAYSGRSGFIGTLSNRSPSMSFYSNLAIRTKVIAAFVAVLIATGALGFFGLDRLHAVNDNANGILINWLPAIRDLGKVSTLTEQFRSRSLAVIVASTPDEVTAAETAANDVKTQRD